MNAVAKSSSTLVVNTPAEITAVNAGAVKKHIQDSLKEEHTRVELRMQGTRFIDSSGLGVLVYLNKQMSARGGSVRLKEPARGVLQVLQMTRMTHMFEILP